MPLLAAAAAAGEQLSRHGKVFDAMGDVAQNDGDDGHATRHCSVLAALYAALRSVWGGHVKHEPLNYRAYSDHRPDLTADGRGSGGSLLAADLKFFDSIGADGTPSTRGAYVAFGNTHARARELVHGLAARGSASEGTFNALTGKGYVAAKSGDYDRAKRSGVTVEALLFETFGGFSPEVMRLLRRLMHDRDNRLSKREYDETTWAARTWFAFNSQKISVAVHTAAASEIAHALRMRTTGDSRYAADVVAAA